MIGDGSHAASRRVLAALLLSAVCVSPARAADAPPQNGWSRADAAHLLRRAAFSGTPEQIDRIQALGRSAAVEYLLTSALPDGAVPPFPHVELPPLVMNNGDAEEEESKRAAAAAVQAKADAARTERARVDAVAVEKARAAALKTLQATKPTSPPKAMVLIAAATQPAATPATTQPADPMAAAKAAAARAAAAKDAAARDAWAKYTAAKDALTTASAARANAAKDAATAAAAAKAADAKAALAKKKAVDAKRGIAMNAVRSWWIDRMIRSDRPLEEKMSLFWHGLLTSGLREVGSADPMAAQNLLFHEQALGNFKSLGVAILHDSAMLKYLNNDQNLKGRPNENLAREYCELFTMGEGHGYTEKDIAEIARALTGATAKGGKGGYVFAADKHDDTDKTIFGATGAYKPEDIAALVFARPEPSDYLARRLWEFFAYGDPTAEDVAPVAEALRKSGLDLVPALRVLFNSAAFYSDRARFAQVKSPVEHIVSTIRLLEIPCATPAQLNRVGNAISAAGQALFQPPNVRGWPGGENWITTATLYTRYNAAAALADGTLDARPPVRPNPAPPPPKAPAAATRPAGGPSAPTTAPAARKTPAPAVPPPPVFAPASPAKLFAALGATPPGAQLVDAAMDRFLQRPLSAAKRQVLIEFLGPQPLRCGTAESDTRILQLIGLILSTPQYQME